MLSILGKVNSLLDTSLMNMVIVEHLPVDYQLRISLSKQQYVTVNYLDGKYIVVFSLLQANFFILFCDKRLKTFAETPVNYKKICL